MQVTELKNKRFLISCRSFMTESFDNWCLTNHCCNCKLEMFRAKKYGKYGAKFKSGTYMLLLGREYVVN